MGRLHCISIAGQQLKTNVEMFDGSVDTVFLVRLSVLANNQKTVFAWRFLNLPTFANARERYVLCCMSFVCLIVAHDFSQWLDVSRSISFSVNEDLVNIQHVP